MTVAWAEDTAHVVLRWTAVPDRRGDPVQRYEWAVRNFGVIAASGSTTDTIAYAAIAKVPGDSMVLVGEVLAVDTRGTRGALATTAPLVVHVPDPGPIAPQIQIDTVPVAPGGLSLDSIRIYAPSGELEADGTLTLVVGDSVQLCAMGFAEGRAFVLDGQPAACTGTGGLGLLRPRIFSPMTGIRTAAGT